MIVILIGGLVELIPTFLVKSNIPTISSVQPYTPLELQGRDIYVREGCYTCHSQMIRPFRSETERYGEYSKAGEFVYDHPFQWGSKRTGPDLAREGTGNLKKTEAEMIPKFLEWYGSEDVCLYYAFCFEGKDVAFRTPDQVMQLYQEGYDKQWPDGKIYRTIKIKIEIKLG